MMNLKLTIFWEVVISELETNVRLESVRTVVPPSLSSPPRLSLLMYYLDAAIGEIRIEFHFFEGFLVAQTRILGAV
jgi:hypothetical protein